MPQALKFKPMALEGMDQLLVDFVLKKQLYPDDVAMLPDGHGWLIGEIVRRRARKRGSYWTGSRAPAKLVIAK